MKITVKNKSKASLVINLPGYNSLVFNVGGEVVFNDEKEFKPYQNVVQGWVVENVLEVIAGEVKPVKQEVKEVIKEEVKVKEVKETETVVEIKEEVVKAEVREKKSKK